MDRVAGKPAATDKSQGSCNFPESESWNDNEHRVTGKPVATRNSGNSGNSEAEGHIQKVYSIVRHIYGRSPTDEMDDLDGRTAMWRISMSVTLQAAVHLGQDYMVNLRFTKNHLLMSVKQYLQMSENLNTNQPEITGLTTIDWTQPMWRATTLLCDKAVEITNAKTYVFSDSVLCLGYISDQPV